jgi:hypothetical protein
MIAAANRDVRPMVATRISLIDPPDREYFSTRLLRVEPTVVLASSENAALRKNEMRILVLLC